MTTKHDDGDPAFPVFPETGNGHAAAFRGMSLRDYFAGQALTAMVAGDGARMVAARDERYDETNWREIVASNAYDFADAMLAERERRTKQEGSGE